MIGAALENDWTDRARPRTPLRTPVRSQFLGVNPAPVKTVLNLMGECMTPCVCRSFLPWRQRAPGWSASSENSAC